MLHKTSRSTPRSKPGRVQFDAETAYAILDEALNCAVGFVDDGLPVVIPTLHWRVGDRLYFHGSPGSRLARVMAAGRDLCVTVTLVDGVVLARSAMHHSLNYRSVVLFGTARAVTDDDEKTRVLEALMDKFAPGRRAHVRPPSAKESTATKLLAMTIDEGSVKARSGPPVDAESDMTRPVWAGVLPLALTAGEAIADDGVPPGLTTGKPAVPVTRP